MGMHRASHGCRALGTLRLRQTTTWPSAELEVRSLAPFACRPRFETATSLVVPAPRSRRNSPSDLLPPGSRSVARDQAVAAIAMRRAAGRGHAGQDVGAGMAVTDVEVELSCRTAVEGDEAAIARDRGTLAVAVGLFAAQGCSVL